MIYEAILDSACFLSGEEAVQEAREVPAIYMVLTQLCGFKQTLISGHISASKASGKLMPGPQISGQRGVIMIQSFPKKNHPQIWIQEVKNVDRLIIGATIRISQESWCLPYAGF